MAGFRTFVKNFADSFDIKGYAGEFSGFERKGLDVIEENENTTTLLKSMVNYMKIFVDKSEVVNTRLGEIKVSVDDMHVTLKSVKEDTVAIRYDTKKISLVYMPIDEETVTLL